jgi:hypothetical protein
LRQRPFSEWTKDHNQQSIIEVDICYFSKTTDVDDRAALSLR